MMTTVTSLNDGMKQAVYAERRRKLTEPQLDRHFSLYFVEPPPKNKKGATE
jgi:hypothetical protein